MNKQNLSNLISLGEGFTTEFKRTGTSNLDREICAFANATGGIILIGVADDGVITGVGNHNDLKSKVQSIARSAEPPIAVDVEQVGSGIKRIREMCRDYGVAEPVIEVSENWVTTTFKRPIEQVAGEVTPQVTPQVETKLAPSRNQVRIERILGNSKALQAILRQFESDTGQVTGQVAGQVLIHCEEPRTGRDIQELLGLKHRETFLNNYLKPLLKSGWIKMTIPDKPTSSKQKYRITEKGRALLTEIEGVQE